jgi:hypothetical protein
VTAPNLSIPLDAFLATLNASGLLPNGCAAALGAFRASDLSQGSIAGSAQAFGDYLVSQGLLTRWQCDRILEGRHIGFFVEQYKIVSFVRCEETHTVYLAEDPATGSRVHVLATPPPCLPEGLGQVRIIEID